MKLWEYRIKQFEYNLDENKIQIRSRKNYEVEEILSDFGKDGYELINVITEKVLSTSNSKYIRTFFLKKERKRIEK